MHQLADSVVLVLNLESWTPNERISISYSQDCEICWQLTLQLTWLLVHRCVVTRVVTAGS